MNNAGKLVTHYVYDAFGEVVSGDTSKTRYLYTGRELDTATGLQYNHHRWYDPHTGRWLSEDPIGFAGGDYNLGRYVGNSSVFVVDPAGLSELTPDQQRMLDMAGDDAQLRNDLRDLIDTLSDHPRYRYLPWPFATKDRCHRWINEVSDDNLDRATRGRKRGYRLTPWEPAYIGPIPTFYDHGVLIVEMNNGKKCYLDNYLYGEDDHILFTVPGDLVDKKSPEYNDYLDRLIRRHRNTLP